MRRNAVNRTATRPVEAPGTGILATYPVETPGARTDVNSQPTGTGSADISAVDRSLTSKRTVAADNTGVSDMEDEQHSEPESPDVVSDWEVLSDRDTPKEDEFDP